MTMWHPTEDELVEHLSGDPDRQERQRIDGHLVACDDCRQAAEEINVALSLVETTVPEPAAGFERVMWARIQQAIEVDAARARPGMPPSAGGNGCRSDRSPRSRSRERRSR